MKILVIRLSSIGDIVFTTPVIRCLKKQLPGTEVHFLTKKKFRTVTEHNPYIDRFFYYDNSLSAIKKDLKEQRYDYVIDLHKNIRSLLIRLALRRKTFVFRKLSFRKLLLTKWHIDFMPGRHIVDRNMDTVKKLGVSNDGEGLDYFIAPGERVDPGMLPQPFQKGFVAVVIGASYFTKKLPVPNLQELCRQMALPVILIGGPEDKNEGAAIASVQPEMIYNACGQFSLNQSADLVRQSTLVIAHDTGLQYIACAFGKPVLSVWGGTSPSLDVEPYYGRKIPEGLSFTHKNFLVPGLPCQPCSRYGSKKCPRGHFKCMKQQDVAAIAATARSVWDVMLQA